MKPIVDEHFMLKDTYDFLNKVLTIDTNLDKCMVSFDVESLFTNVLTQETIEIIQDLIYTKEINKFHKLSMSPGS